MSASEYWSPLEHILSQDTAVLHPETEIPDMLIRERYVAEVNRQAVTELLAQHQYGWSETDYDHYCQCGKWLEYDHYELPDHQSAVLEDAGLILPEYGPEPPPRPQPPPVTVPAMFQWPKRNIRIDLPTTTEEDA